MKLPSTIDIQPTLDRIAKGIADPHNRDGSTFFNNKNQLPMHEDGYYMEYVIRTPGIEKVGPQRLVIGKKWRNVLYAGSLSQFYKNKVSLL